MIDSLLHIFVFFVDVLVLAIAIIFVFASLVAIAAKNKLGPKNKITITNLNDHYKALRDLMIEDLASKKQKKALKKANKALRKNKKTQACTFVIDFNGDIKASQVDNLREEISAILQVATPDDTVFVRLESPGGVVHGYGLAASQLQRIKAAGIPLTISIDKVAASGGYMMACIADKIIAAPFAIIGSIGVIMQLPNFHKWLKKHDVDFEQITAGEYKRTLTMLGENTDKDREKALEDIADIHALFKQHVAEHRKQVDISKVATGEFWYGKRALDLQLVDTLETSDDFLMSQAKTHELRLIKREQKKTLLQKLTHSAQLAWDKLMIKPVSLKG